MKQHSKSALAIARYLQEKDAISAVFYPALTKGDAQNVFGKQMSDGGGLLGFELSAGLEAGRKFMNALKLVHRAVSLGDAETLVQHPASMTHATYSPEERAHYGISDGLVRMSVGLENTEDLLDDLEQAFNQL